MGFIYRYLEGSMKKILLLLLLISTTAYADDTDRSLNYIINRVWDESTQSLNVSDTGGLLSLTDPNSSNPLGWDDVEGAYKFWTLGTGLSYDAPTDTLSATATSSGWTDAGTATVDLVTKTDDVIIGASDLGAKVNIDGDADETQFHLQMHSTQTSVPFVIEASDGTDRLSIDSAGVLTVSGSGSGGLTLANGSTSGGTITIKEDTDDGTNYASFTVPALASNTVYTLPPDDGTANQVLSTDGAGVLGWVTVASGVPTTITVADTTDATSFIGLFESATGDLGPKTDGALLYNASNGLVTTTTLTLTGSGAQSTITEGLIVNNGAGTDEDDDFTVNVTGGAYEIDAGAGTITSTANSAGWSVVAGADTACTTTCTSACLFGVNTASLTADIVDCADATADECLCMGAS